MPSLLTHLRTITLYVFSSFLLFGASAAVAYAAVIFTEDYESGNLGQWVENGGCFDYSFAVVDDPQQAGNKVVRVTWISGTDNSTCAPPWNNRSRSELKPKTDAAEADYQVDHWVGERILLSPDWPPVQPAPRMNLSQLIPVFENQEGTDMKFHIDRSQNYELEVRVGNDARRNFDLGPIKSGVWENWVFHYRRSLGNDGAAQVWRSGKLVVDYRGQTTYTTDDNSWWKHGIYSAATDSNPGRTYTVYFDDVTIAEGSNQYDAVAPDGTDVFTPGPCSLYPAGSANFSPYGLHWDWTSQQRELLLKATCQTDSTTVNIGNGRETGSGSNAAGLTYVYHQGYWNSGSGAWTPYSLQCSGTDKTKIVNAWCKGSA